MWHTLLWHSLCQQRWHVTAESLARLWSGRLAALAYQFSRSWLVHIRSYQASLSASSCTMAVAKDGRQSRMTNTCLSTVSSCDYSLLDSFVYTIFCLSTVSSHYLIVDSLHTLQRVFVCRQYLSTTNYIWTCNMKMLCHGSLNEFYSNSVYPGTIYASCQKHKQNSVHVDLL